MLHGHPERRECNSCLSERDLFGGVLHCQVARRRKGFLEDVTEWRSEKTATSG